MPVLLWRSRPVLFQKIMQIDLYKILYYIWNCILNNHNLIQITDISIYDNANMIRL